jgi:hypothetical protein
MALSVAYWALRENSQFAGPSGWTGAPPESQATAPSAPAPAAPSSPAVIAQSNQPAASPAPSLAPPPSANAESPVPLPAKPAASTATLPVEDQMSEADRRQIQKMLQDMKYYQGPVDGKFGPLTRAAIRRYQDRIGAKSTGSGATNTPPGPLSGGRFKRLRP